MSASRGTFSAGRILAMLAGAVVLALLVCELAGWRFLRGPAARAISDAVGTEVVIEAPFRAHLLWNPGVQAGRLTVAAANDVDVPHLLDANEVEVRWGWLDVWRWQQGGPLALRMLGAKHLDARLVRPDASHASWLIGPQGEAESPQTATRPAFRIDALRVADGVVKVDDALNDLTLAAKLSLGEGAADDAERGLRVNADGRWRDQPVKIDLIADSVMLLLGTSDNAAAQPVALKIDAALGSTHARFDGTVASLLGARALKGEAQASGPSLHMVGESFGVSMPHTPDFDLKGRVTHENGVWQTTFDAARFGDSTLAGTLRFDSTATPPRLDGKVSGKRLTLTDFGPVIGTDTPPEASDRVLPDRPLDLPTLQGLDADVQLAIDTFDFGTPTLKPMHELRGEIIVDKGVLKVRSLNAQAVGGRFTGDIEIDSAAQPARWHAALRVAGFDVGQWLRVGDGEAGSSNGYLDGELHAAIQVTGYGRSTQDVLGSLEGQADARLRDGSVSHLVMEAIGLDLAQALGVAISGDETLALRCARLQSPIDKGVFDPLTAVLDNRDSTIRVRGRISLADETLALRVEAKPKDVSLLSLRSPVLVGGTLSKPEIGVEGSALAPQLLAAAALAIVAPVAAWVPLIDLGEDGQSDPCKLNTEADASEARNTESESKQSKEGAARQLPPPSGPDRRYTP